MCGEREPEHGVAEEGQPRVGVRTPLRPRGVREHLAVQVLGQLFEEFGEQLQDSLGSWVAVVAMTKSTAWPTVTILAACSSGILTP